MDYYIRSWDPDSTYPANPQEGDVCYTITLDQSWAPVAGVKNDNLLKEEVYENGEWKEVGGGGGGGDSYPKFVINGTMAGAPPVITWGDSTCSMTYAELLEYLGGISGENRAAIVEENMTDPGGTTTTTIYGASMMMDDWTSGNPIYVNWAYSLVYIEVASDGSISVEDVDEG